MALSKAELALAIGVDAVLRGSHSSVGLDDIVGRDAWRRRRGRFKLQTVARPGVLTPLITFIRTRQEEREQH